MVWDATCPNTLAPSYSDLTRREAGAVAEEVGRRKTAKYGHLEASHCFVPAAIETLAQRPAPSSRISDAALRTQPWSPFLPTTMKE